MERLFWLITGPLFYASALVFIVAVGRKIYEYATMPRHLRWDIYPVPHQGIEGSKYQKVDFYKQPYHVAKEEEMKEMLPEMLFIKKMYVNNFKLWQGSWLLHMGVYMLFLWLALVVVGALLNALGFEISLANRSWLITAFVYLTAAAGWAGTIAGVVGTVMLL